MQGAWAIQDERYITPPTKGRPHERWHYDGLTPLQSGDYLKAFDADGILYWEGPVHFDPEGRPVYRDRLWHAVLELLGGRRSLTPEQWARMFTEEMTGEVTRG